MPKGLVQQYAKDPKQFLDTHSVEDVVSILREAKHAFFNTDKPVLTDNLYDIAKDHLEVVAPKHPFHNEVGADEAVKKVKLPYWMGSLNKIRDSQKEIEKWVTTTNSSSVVVSDKLDGNSALLVYKKTGKICLYTRGNGVDGQDISKLVKMMKLPDLKAKAEAEAKGDTKAKAKGEFAVRGELIISKSKWNTNLGANARNVVAGILHTKTPDPQVVQLIDFVAYEIVNPRVNTISKDLEQLKQLGFNTVENNTFDANSLSSELLSSILLQRRNKSPYEIDGIVIYDNTTSHPIPNSTNPKYAFAFKSVLTHTEAEVLVSSVEWNASKDGYLKPIVHFNEISLGGVNIQKATGFNGAFIRDNKIGPGAKIVIIRSGDVIPHITRVVIPAEAPQMPEVNYHWTDTNVDIVLDSDTEGNTNTDVIIKQLTHFSKTMQLTGISNGIITKLVNEGNIRNIKDLLGLTLADLLKISGFQKVSATKVLTSLQTVKSNGLCVDLMVASGIFGRGMGTKKIVAITDTFPEILSSRVVPSVSQIESVPGIGNKTAIAFIEDLTKFFMLIDSLDIKCKSKQSDSPQKKIDFSNQKIVFTGFRNKEWEEQIKLGNGSVVTSITKNVTMVVAADPNDSSSKLVKARELGIKIVSKEEFAAQLS